jgi:hypothetical protein
LQGNLQEISLPFPTESFRFAAAPVSPVGANSDLCKRRPMLTGLTLASWITHHDERVCSPHHRLLGFGELLGSSVREEHVVLVA